MALLPLVLGGRTRPLASAAPSGKAAAADVFARDRHTCRYCGFAAQKFQDVHRVDGARAEGGDILDPELYVTACFWCHRVQHLDQVAEEGSGVLIWLPEIGQAALHHLCRAIYLAQTMVSPVRQGAEAALAALALRAEQARARIGTDDPGVLAAAFDELSDREYGQRGDKLAGIRLLPSRMKMENGKDVWGQVITYWRGKGGPFGGRMPLTWPEMLAGVRAGTMQTER